MQRRFAEAFDGSVTHRFLLGIQVIADEHHRYRRMAGDQLPQYSNSGRAVGIQHAVHEDERVGIGREQFLGIR